MRVSLAYLCCFPHRMLSVYQMKLNATKNPWTDALRPSERQKSVRRNNSIQCNPTIIRICSQEESTVGQSFAGHRRRFFSPDLCLVARFSLAHYSLAIQMRQNAIEWKAIKQFGWKIRRAFRHGSVPLRRFACIIYHIVMCHKLRCSYRCCILFITNGEFYAQKKWTEKWIERTSAHEKTREAEACCMPYTLYA